MMIFRKIQNHDSESCLAEKNKAKTAKIWRWKKVKRGRPRKVSFAKNRRVDVILNEKAYFILRAISSKKGGLSWIHDYVSTAIIRDFELDPRFYLINRMRELAVEKDEFNNRIALEMQGIAAQISLIKDAERQKKVLGRELKAIL